MRVSISVILAVLSWPTIITAGETTSYKNTDNDFIKTWVDPRFDSYAIKKIVVRLASDIETGKKWKKKPSRTAETDSMVKAVEAKGYVAIVDYSKDFDEAKVDAVLDVSTERERTEAIASRREGSLITTYYEWQMRQRATLRLPRSNTVVFKVTGRRQDMSQRIHGTSSFPLYDEYAKIIEGLPRCAQTGQTNGDPKPHSN